MRQHVISVAAFLVALVALCALGNGAAGATPPATFQLARARAEFERGEYQRVVDSLAPEIYPKNKIANAEELKEAHYLLGSSYFFLGRQELARQEFTALLFLDPGHDLDPAIDPPRIYAFFQTLKHDLAEKLRAIESTRPPDEPPREVLIERVVHEKPPAITNFVPLGYGQFRNGQRGKGIFFHTSEAILGGTSIGIFTYQAVTYGIPSRYSGNDSGTLKTLQILQVTTGSLFLVVYGIGVYDAFANQKPAYVEEKRSERPLTPAPPPAKPKTSLNFVPLLSPDGVGLGAMGRF